MLREFLRTQAEAAAVARAAEEAATAKRAAAEAEQEAARSAAALAAAEAEARALLATRTLRNSVRLSENDTLLLQQSGGDAEQSERDARYAAERAARQARFSEGAGVLARQLTVASTRRERLSSLLADASGSLRHSRGISAACSLHNVRSSSCVKLDSDQDGLLLQVAGVGAHRPALLSEGLQARDAERVAEPAAPYLAAHRTSTAPVRHSMAGAGRLTLHLEPTPGADHMQQTEQSSIRPLNSLAGQHGMAADAALAWPWVVQGHRPPVEQRFDMQPGPVVWAAPEVPPYPGSMLRRPGACAVNNTASNTTARDAAKEPAQAHAIGSSAPQQAAVPFPQATRNFVPLPACGVQSLGVVTTTACSTRAQASVVQAAVNKAVSSRSAGQGPEQMYANMARCATAPQPHTAARTQQRDARRIMAKRAARAAPAVHDVREGSPRHIAMVLCSGAHGVDIPHMASLGADWQAVMQHHPCVKSLVGLQQMQQRACTAPAAAVHRVPCSAQNATVLLSTKQAVGSGVPCACCSLKVQTVANEMDKCHTPSMQSRWPLFGTDGPTGAAPALQLSATSMPSGGLHDAASKSASRRGYVATHAHAGAAQPGTRPTEAQLTASEAAAGVLWSVLCAVLILLYCLPILSACITSCLLSARARHMCTTI